MSQSQAFPLQWPSGWPRSRVQSSARFKQKQNQGWMASVTVAIARQRLQNELDLIRASYVTLSTNVELRLDGQPRSTGGREPTDTGAAVYFRLADKHVALACDRWDRVADNIVALSKHLEAMRGMERWGVGTAAQMFAGYEALPAPEQWYEVLGVARSANKEGITEAYRRLAAKAHPDRGGSNAAMARLNAARDAGMAAVA